MTGCASICGFLASQLWLNGKILTYTFFLKQRQNQGLFLPDYQHSPLLGELWQSLYSWKMKPGVPIYFCFCVIIHCTKVYWRTLLLNCLFCFHCRKMGLTILLILHPLTCDLQSCDAAGFPWIQWPDACQNLCICPCTEFRERVFLPQLWYFFTDEIFSSTQAIRTLCHCELYNYFKYIYPMEKLI